MMVIIKPEWSKPSTILFATEYPVNEKNFTFALAQAKESGAHLIILHVRKKPSRPSSFRVTVPEMEDPESYSAEWLFEPLIHHAKDLSIRCRAVIREGSPADEILRFLRETKVDRVVMGVRTPGPVGRLLVGSVAETLLRTADVPVTIASSYLAEGTYRDLLTRTILCAVSRHRSSEMAARFAAELAARLGARLILQHVISPQESAGRLSSVALTRLERELFGMIPAAIRAKLNLETMATLGDPTEELLYQSQVQHANLIVMDAHNATHFAAVSNANVIYKVLAYAHCPVITLSPVLLADYGPGSEKLHSPGVDYIAGVV